jgi:hypothetical protein
MMKEFTGKGCRGWKMAERVIPAVTCGLARRSTRNRSCWVSWTPGTRRQSRIDSLCQIQREPQGPPTHGLSLYCPCVCAAETRSAHPHSYSFRIRRAITAAFVSPLLLPTRHATLPPPPSRRPWSACIRAVPFVALSSMASDQCIAHHRSWHHFSRSQHFVEHLNCIFDTATPAPPKITVA